MFTGGLARSLGKSVSYCRQSDWRRLSGGWCLSVWDYRREDVDLYWLVIVDTDTNTLRTWDTNGIGRYLQETNRVSLTVITVETYESTSRKSTMTCGELSKVVQVQRKTKRHVEPRERDLLRTTSGHLNIGSGEEKELYIGWLLACSGHTRHLWSLSTHIWLEWIGRRRR